MADILISLLAVYLIASLPCAMAIGCLLRAGNRLDGPHTRGDHDAA